MSWKDITGCKSQILLYYDAVLLYYDAVEGNKTWNVFSLGGNPLGMFLSID